MEKGEISGERREAREKGEETGDRREMRGERGYR
jgi:hypothetical protein